MSDDTQTTTAPATPAITEPEKPKGSWRERMEAAKAAKAAAGPDPLAPVTAPVGATPAPEPEKLARAKAAAEKLRADQEQRRQQHAQAQRLNQETETLRTQLAESKKAEERLSHLSKLVSEDPYAAMHELGITVDSLAKHGTPEAAMAKLQQDYDRRVQAAEAKTQALEDQIKAEKRAQAYEAGKAQLLGLVESGTYPTLMTLPDEDILEQVNKVLVTAHQREGVWYPFEDALGYLEKRYADAAARRQPAGQTSTIPQNGAARAGADKTKARSTLPNQQATTVSSTNVPLKDLPEDERRARVREVLRERFSKRRSQG